MHNILMSVSKKSRHFQRKNPLCSMDEFLMFPLKYSEFVGVCD